MLKQQLNFKLSQKLSPQQIQLMKLIQLPTQAFEQRISQEMNENPALEGGKDEGDTFDEEFSNEDDYGDDNEVIETDINVDDYLSDDENRITVQTTRISKRLMHRELRSTNTCYNN